VFALIGWFIGEVALEARRRRRLRALVARPVVQVEEVPMPKKVDVRMKVTIADVGMLNSILRKMRIRGLRLGANEIEMAWDQTPGGRSQPEAES